MDSQPHGQPVHFGKPVSSSALKRHPATASQSGNQSSCGTKKKGGAHSTSKQFTDKGRGQPTGISSQSTNNTTVMSNQKSSPNIHKSKRAGTFLKNCKTKF